MPRFADPDPPLPTAFGATDALAAGLTRDQIRQRVRSGAWVRVGQGRYLKASVIARLDDPFAIDRVLHAARAAASAQRNPGSVIAFASAAVIHQLQLWEPLPPYVSLLVGPDHWTGRRGGAAFRHAHLPDEHVSRTPVPITTPARTWFDIGRTSSLAQTLAMGDAGLRTGAFTRSRLVEVVDQAGPVDRIRRVMSALTHVDARRESPLESSSWAYFIDHHVPLPELQAEFVDDQGRFVARVDFWWPQASVVGECDGRLKYSTKDDLYAEKRREDRLRALGLTVVRWGAPDLRTRELADRLARHLRT